MSRQEANEQYAKALKAGQKHYRDCVIRGRYPYPQVLDEILDDSMAAGRVDMGLISIPTEGIVGTKAAGRTSAFAANFMPLLAANTEFAAKWVELCMAHLGEGIRDPIRCYEYMGRFYVQEGNKRVSVLKSYGAPAIDAFVTRVIPAYSQDQAVQVYYEFLNSFPLTGLYQVRFSQLGGFAKLQAALGFEPDHVWTKEERQRFLSGYTYFQAAFRKLGGEGLPLTTADALLVWLRVYTFEELKTQTAQELTKNLSAIWADVKVLAHPAPITVSTSPQEEPDKGLLNRLLDAVRPNHIHVAFINERNPVDSTWTSAHDLGRQYLEQALAGRVTVRTYNMVQPGENAETVMEQAIAEGAQVLFATTPPLIAACRKIAVRHPGVRILNCSVSMPYTGVRTYYSRIYEGKFITGAIAGAMAKDDQVGYVASYPIFGVPAGINAFALGARLANPRVKIYLHWSCTPGNALDLFTRQGISIISNRDIPTPDLPQQDWGVYQVGPGGAIQPLASPYWHWGRFYEKMIRSILNGGWDALNAEHSEQAVNYWWGMSSGVVDVRIDPSLPDGVQHLAEILKRGIVDGSIDPFHRLISSQDGALRNDGNQWYSPEEILHMDWLCDCVEGSIPTFDQLLPMSQARVRLQGVYRDRIPPEKEGTLL